MPAPLSTNAMNSLPLNSNPNLAVSLVIPVHNEAESLPPLIEQCNASLAGAGVESYEILVVDDGSRDGSWAVLEKLAADPENHVHARRLRRNFGKAIALSVGFEQAVGSIVVTLDGDLQDDPAEIPRMLAKLDEGFDVVSGWKQNRQDPLGKTLPSRFFNYVTARLSGLRLHDFNCGFKAYRAEVTKSVQLYGELHRYIPVLADHQGFRVAEIAVKHHPRKFGTSKYGIERMLRGAIDLLTVIATTKYLSRPAHLFGGAGFCLSIVGFIQLAYLSVLWFTGNGPIGNRPLLTLGVLCMFTGVQLMCFGLLAELLIRRVGQTDSSVYVADTTATSASASPSSS